jgi:Ca-activated chloride channel family protein
MSRTRRWRALGRHDPPRRLFTPRLALVLSAWALALAFPTLATIPLAAAGREIVLVLDVSLSMAATDAWPSRLDSAVTAARSLVETLARGGGDRVGVVAFAGRAVPVCPVTENLGAVVETLDRLRPGSVEPGGSDLGAALTAALAILDATGSDASRALILLSDGEDHRPAWAEVVAECRRRGIPVHAVALGDPAGSPLPARPSILTRRQDDSPRAIAEATGGVFLPVGTSRVDLGPLYRDRIEPLTLSRLAPAAPARAVAPFVPLLLVGLTTFLLELARTVRSPIPDRPPSIVRLLSPRRAPVLALLALLGVPAPPDLPRREDQDQTLAALAAYEKAIERDPDDPYARHNAAACLYRLGRFEQALVRYQEARARDGRLAVRLEFALGNTLASLGRFEEAIIHYDACLRLPARSPEDRRLHDDARANRAAVVKRLADRENPQPKAPEEQGSRTPRPASGGNQDGTASRPASSPSEMPPGSSDGSPNVSNDPNSRLDRALRAIDASRRAAVRPAVVNTADPDRKDW